MSEKIKYQYSSKKEYSSINKKIVEKKRQLHEEKQNKTYYSVEIKYYKPYKMYYVDIPQEYLNNIKQLRKKKEDIFSHGKILTFTEENEILYFDAVIDSTEDRYAYLIPIKEKYRYSNKLEGNYNVCERIGDLTYYRMGDAIDEFLEGKCCSKEIENYILGNNISKKRRNLKNIFNYNKFYYSSIPNYAELTRVQETQMRRIFFNEMNTIQMNINADKKLICLIIYAIHEMRKRSKDKILVCSSSNSVADSIALNLLKLKQFDSKLNLLRIYAKNQEIIKRNKKLYEISFHGMMKKKYDIKFQDRQEKADWILEDKDIIISTCVNSYNDDIINYEFPFVIIIDANNSNENESLIPITLKAKHVVLISYQKKTENNNRNYNNDQDEEEDDELNLYERMVHLYPRIHCTI